MNKSINIFIFLLFEIIVGIMLFELIDFRKRDFKSVKLRQFYWILIFFPPLIGSIIYYAIVIRKNGYGRIIQKACPQCKNTGSVAFKKNSNEWFGLLIIFLCFLLISQISTIRLYFFVMLAAFLGLYLILWNGYIYKCSNCGYKLKC